MKDDFGRQCIALLLAQDRSGTFVSTSFRRALDHYALEVIQKCTAVGPPERVFDFDALSRYVDACNLGALIQHLRGCPTAAIAVAVAGIHIVRYCATRTCNPSWNILVVQPVINIARVLRALGRRAESKRILSELRNIVMLGQAGELCGASFELADAKRLRGISPRAEEVITHTLEIDELKCAIADHDYESVKRLTDGTWDRRPVGWELRLELRLKAELELGEPWRVATITREVALHEPWVTIYLVDAFVRQKLFREATTLISSISSLRAISDFGDAAECLYCALAVRAASAEDYEVAATLGRRAWSAAMAQQSEVGLIRAGTLLAALELIGEGEYHVLDELWSVITASRHNYERLNSCAALAVVECRSGIDRHSRGAASLRKLLPWTPTRSDFAALNGALTHQKWEHIDVTQGEESLDVRCPAADSVKEHFECYFNATALGQDWRTLLITDELTVPR